MLTFCTPKQRLYSVPLRSLPLVKSAERRADVLDDENISLTAAFITDV